MASDERTPGTSSDEAADIARLIKELESAGKKSVPPRPAPSSPARSSDWSGGGYLPRQGCRPGPSSPWLPVTPTSAAIPVTAIGIDLSRLTAWIRSLGPQPVSGPLGPAGVWTCVALGVLLGVSLLFWPYARGCGTGLFCYMAAVGMVYVAGVWGAWHAWDSRVGFAHVLALVTVLWGFSLTAREILPRIGYAKTSATWVCSMSSSPRV